MTDSIEKRRVFRDLHVSGCFVIPNPWDAGSARLLEGLGFRALATTSSGVAWSLGRTDNHVPFERALDRIREIAESVRIPVNADFEGGFAIDADGVYKNVAAATETGVAGLSIEDSTGDAANPLFDFSLAVDRVRAASRAIDENGEGVLLTGRSEGFIVGRPDLSETIRRLVAYAEAGADCLYAPGIRSNAESIAMANMPATKPAAYTGAEITVEMRNVRPAINSASPGRYRSRALLEGSICFTCLLSSGWISATGLKPWAIRSRPFSPRENSWGNSTHLTPRFWTE
jgi:2-methylisocitrate lyase-like PEP mutase family enzyme